MQNEEHQTPIHITTHLVHAPSPPPAALRRRAFTLVELAVVMVIFGIVAVVAIPRLGGGALYGSRLRSASVRLAATMDRARDRAISFCRTHWVVIETRTGQYALVAEGLDGEPPETVATANLPEGFRFEAIRLAGERGVMPETVRLAFAPEGWMDDADVIVTDERGEAYTVVVSSAGGGVEVHEGRLPGSAGFAAPGR